MWPVAMPLLYALLLYHCRHPILKHQPTALSRATRFLWSEYDDNYYWFEMGACVCRRSLFHYTSLPLGGWLTPCAVDLMKKLSLTNFVLFLNFGNGGNDKLLRLLVGLLIALLGLILQLQTQPFRKQTGTCRATQPRIVPCAPRHT